MGGTSFQGLGTKILQLPYFTLRHFITKQDVNIFIVFSIFDISLWAEILNKELKHCDLYSFLLMDNLLSTLFYIPSYNSVAWSPRFSYNLRVERVSFPFLILLLTRLFLLHCGEGWFTVHITLSGRP